MSRAPLPSSPARPGAVPSAGEERLYFDGECGLCHRWVLFTLRRERGRALFRYAPLQGPTFAADVPAEQRATLPDSIVVRAADGRLLVRSEAALHILARLGGGWGALSRALRLVPRFARDGFYDFVARVRRRLFTRPETACPLVPPELVRRFDP